MSKCKVKVTNTHDNILTYVFMLLTAQVAGVFEKAGIVGLGVVDHASHITKFLLTAMLTTPHCFFGKRCTSVQVLHKCPKFG